MGNKEKFGEKNGLTDFKKKKRNKSFTFCLLV